MKKLLKRVFEHGSLSRTEAKEVMLGIGRGIYNQTEITSFITVFLMRSVTIDELQGFRDGLLELALKIELSGGPTMDIVGTGGDGKNTFNISTLSCFIAAGAGIRIAKHGNYGASSISGSSNLMESLGYRFTSDAAVLQKQIDTAGICFLHAPLFHPALKNVAQIRKELGFRTFFNMLGPLVNPADPDYHLIGVYNLEMARIYNYLLQQNDKAYTIIHSLDGYDEISLTNDTRVISRTEEKVMSPQDLGKRMVAAADIQGGQSVEESAKIFLKILQGQGSWAQTAVVLANAAMALHLSGNFSDYNAAYQASVESLESGKANKTFKTLMEMQ